MDNNHRETAHFEETIRALESELGLMITLHDVGGVFHDSEGEPIFSPARQSHRRNPLCFCLDRDRCVEQCMNKVNARCIARGETCFVMRCWAGLTEVVAPLRRGNMHVGTISAGVWRKSRRSTVPEHYASSRKLSKLFEALPCFDPERGSRIGEILFLAGQGLLAKLDSIQSMEASGNRKSEIFRFISMNANKPISTRDLATKLHLSSSRAGHLVSELFGESFVDILMRERLKRAKTLLLSTDLRVREIAQLSGFGNEFHFSRFFRKTEGVSPGVYRKKRLR